jgi:hypothetical protein
MSPSKDRKTSRLRTLIGLAAGLAAAGSFLSAGAAMAMPPPAPGLDISPSSYDYGQVQVDQTASTTFTIHNTGGRGTGALSVQLEGSSQFTITSDSCSGSGLGPYRSCAVEVQFAPTAADSSTGTLTVSARRADAVSAPISGTGFVPAPPGNLYWTNVATGTVNMADLDGTNAASVATDQPGPEGVAVDSTHLYWGNSGAGTIVMANRDGTEPTPIVTGQQPREIAIDTVNDHLYWANFGGPDGAESSVWEANLDGTDPHAVASFTAGQGVAVSGNHLYWTQGDQPIGIMEANLDGSNAHAIIENLEVHHLAADSNHLYWTATDNNFHAIVGEGNLDGSGAKVIATSTATESIYAGVAVNSTNLYWVDQNLGTVTRAGLDGSSPTTVVSGDLFAWGVAVG